MNGLYNLYNEETHLPNNNKNKMVDAHSMTGDKRTRKALQTKGMNKTNEKKYERKKEIKKVSIINQ